MTVRQAAKNTNNVAGINTEASLSEFPDGFVLDEVNFDVNITGSHSKRPGMAIDWDSVTQPSTVLEGGTSTYVWPNGQTYYNMDVLAVKHGRWLRIHYILNTTPLNILTGFYNDIDLTAYRTSTSVTTSEIEKMDLDMTDGDNKLFVTGRYIQPFYVECTEFFGIDVNKIQIRERDYAGIDDGITLTATPKTTLPATHKYNLMTRGWRVPNIESFETTNGYFPSKNMVHYLGYFRKVPVDDAVPGTSNSYTYQARTLAAIHEWSDDAAASQLLWDESAPTGSIRYNPFDNTYVSSGAAAVQTYDLIDTTPASGAITVDNPTTFAVTVRCTANWVHGLSVTDVVQINNLKIHYIWDILSGPQVGEVDSSNFVVNEQVEITAVPAPALFEFEITLPKPDGITSLLQSGTVSVPGSYTADVADLEHPDPYITDERFTTSIFWQGRMFYGGCRDRKLAGRIYFSQVGDQPFKYGECLTEADPTNENYNAPLPTDGGVIVIPELGRLYRFVSFGNSILAFAETGVWRIGPGELGIFSATSYTLRKVTDVGAVGKHAIVVANNTPYYWSHEGVMRIDQDPQQGFLFATNLSLNKINGLYAAIPPNFKARARGAYDHRKKRLLWIYNGLDTSTVRGLALGRIGLTQDGIVPDPDRNKTYFYDHGLVYDLRLEAFTRYQFTNVTTSSLLDVVSMPPTKVCCDKDALLFVARLVDGGTTQIQFATLSDTTNWRDFDSLYGYRYSPTYLVSGTINLGDNTRQRTAPIVHAYFKEQAGTGCLMTAIWDLAGTTNTGKVSNPIKVYRSVRPNSADYNVIVTRNKVRGRGRNLSFLFEALNGTPCWLEGWQTEYDITEKP